MGSLHGYLRKSQKRMSGIGWFLREFITQYEKHEIIREKNDENFTGTIVFVDFVHLFSNDGFCHCCRI